MVFECLQQKYIMASQTPVVLQSISLDLGKVIQTAGSSNNPFFFLTNW